MDTYKLAFVFVVLVDAALKEGIVHLRDRHGRLITSLDQLVVAIQEGRWPVEAVGSRE